MKISKKRLVICHFFDPRDTRFMNSSLLSFNRRLFPREITRRFKENQRSSSRHRLRQRFVSRIIENCGDLGRMTVIWPIDRYPRLPVIPTIEKGGNNGTSPHDGRRDNFEIRSDPSELMIPGAYLYGSIGVITQCVPGVVEPESRKRFDERHGKNDSIP